MQNQNVSPLELNGNKLEGITSLNKVELKN